MKGKLTIVVEFDRVPAHGDIRERVREFSDTLDGSANTVADAEGNDLDTNEVHLVSANLSTFEEITVSVL